MEQKNENPNLYEVTSLIAEESAKRMEGVPVLTWSLIKRKVSFGWSKTVSDGSFWTLLFSNIIAIYFINKNHVPIQSVLLIYVMQSIIIGLINVARMLLLKDYSAGKTAENPTGKSSLGGKAVFAGFFLIHYGAFHVAYLFAIASGGVPDWKEIFSISSIFLINHIFSFVRNFKQETEGQDMMNLLFYPYLRIIPMHLVIIVGSMFPTFSFNLFLFLKAAIDLLSHAFKHKK